MDGIKLIKNNIKFNPNGNVYKYLEKSIQFKRISEVYFSKIKKNAIKAWKKNKSSKQFFYVIEGGIILKIFDDRKIIKKTFQISLGKKFKFSKIIIPKDVWYGFKGLEKNNIIVNSLSINHNKCKLLSMKIKNKKIPIFWN